MTTSHGVGAWVRIKVCVWGGGGEVGGLKMYVKEGGGDFKKNC